MQPTKTMTSDLYQGPLDDPEFLETADRDPEPFPIRTRVRWAVGAAAIVASSWFFAVPQAAGSTPQPLPIVQARGSDTVRGLAEWRQWLETLDADSALDPGVREKLRQSFEELVEPTGWIPAGGMSTPEGAYLLTWEFAQHHLELELFTDHWEWFYKNRETGRLAGEEDRVERNFNRFHRQLAKHAMPSLASA